MNKYLIIYDDILDKCTHEIFESKDVVSLLLKIAKDQCANYDLLKKAFTLCATMQDYIDIFNRFSYKTITDIFVVSYVVYSEP